jgi:mycoredoxin
MTAQPIIVYGTSWCPDCRRAQRVLDQHGVQYTYINIENDPAATEFVIKVNKGNQSVPTIVFPDGSILVEPSNAVLQARLQQLVS